MWALAIALAAGGSSTAAEWALERCKDPAYMKDFSFGEGDPQAALFPPLFESCGRCVRANLMDPDYEEPERFCRDVDRGWPEWHVRGDGVVWLIEAYVDWRSDDGGNSWYNADSLSRGPRRYRGATISHGLFRYRGAQIVDGWSIPRWSTEKKCDGGSGKRCADKITAEWSHDGGETWKPFRIPGDFLLGLHFRTREVGFADVRNYRSRRNVVRLDGPRDIDDWAILHDVIFDITLARLLVTRDGGRTWRPFRGSVAEREQIYQEIACAKPAYWREGLEAMTRPGYAWGQVIIPPHW